MLIVFSVHQDLIALVLLQLLLEVRPELQVYAQLVTTVSQVVLFLTSIPLHLARTHSPVHLRTLFVLLALTTRSTINRFVQPVQLVSTAKALVCLFQPYARLALFV